MMCAIRLIRKDKEHQVFDHIIDIREISVNPIDRPAYVLYVQNDRSCCLEFVFNSDKEKRNKYDNKNIVIEYGINSGRIYTIMTEKNEINQTDFYNIVKNTVMESSTERFKDNIKDFIVICNQIIAYTINNPI